MPLVITDPGQWDPNNPGVGLTDSEMRFAARFIDTIAISTVWYLMMLLGTGASIAIAIAIAIAIGGVVTGIGVLTGTLVPFVAVYRAVSPREASLPLGRQQGHPEHHHPCPGPSSPKNGRHGSRPSR